MVVEVMGVVDKEAEAKFEGYVAHFFPRDYL